MWAGIHQNFLIALVLCGSLAVSSQVIWKRGCRPAEELDELEPTSSTAPPIELAGESERTASSAGRAHAHAKWRINERISSFGRRTSASNQV